LYTISGQQDILGICVVLQTTVEVNYKISLCIL